MVRLPHTPTPSPARADIYLCQRIPFVELDAFVVMPNHVHGILVISGNDNFNTPADIVETRHALSLQTTDTVSVRIETRHCLVSTNAYYLLHLQRGKLLLC